jgi:hypothetical protein
VGRDRQSRQRASGVVRKSKTSKTSKLSRSAAISLTRANYIVTRVLQRTDDDVLNSKKTINDLRFLDNFDEIMDKISGKKENTQKSYLNVVVVALTSIQKTDPALLKKYSIKRDELQEKYNNILASHSKTPSQQANWVTWDDFLELVEKVMKSVEFLNKKKEWSDTEILKYQVKF